jgi:hypothetical protein
MVQIESLAQAYVPHQYTQHQFLSIYSWLHVLALIANIRPYINADTGKNIYCIMVEKNIYCIKVISPLYIYNIFLIGKWRSTP